MSGAVSYHAGVAAEAAVARLYETGGTPITARRWRSEAGEIDLIARNGAEIIFIEVKQSLLLGLLWLCRPLLPHCF